MTKMKVTSKKILLNEISRIIDKYCNSEGVHELTLRTEVDLKDEGYDSIATFSIKFKDL